MDEITHGHILDELNKRMNDMDVASAVLTERTSAMADDVADIKAGLGALQKTMIGLLISLLLIGVSAVLTVILAGGVS